MRKMKVSLKLITASSFMVAVLAALVGVVGIIGIEKINSSIDQVSQVVQQNSATAQESSEASEEMSGQADILKQPVAQFKLKNANTHKQHYFIGEG